jgi:hypothetical protein
LVAEASARLQVLIIEGLWYGSSWGFATEDPEHDLRPGKQKEKTTYGDI